MEENILFQLENGFNYSSTITPSGTQFVLQIEFVESGSCVLQRRISENLWVDDAVITDTLCREESIVTTVTGVTPGEQIRLRFGKKVTPKIINILQL